MVRLAFVGNFSTKRQSRIVYFFCRFLRELGQLKRMADYTSCDSTYLNQVLQGLGQEFSQYTYQMLHSGIQKDTLKYISDDHLSQDCGIDNSIHRLRIAHAIRGTSIEIVDFSIQFPLNNCTVYLLKMSHYSIQCS